MKPKPIPPPPDKPSELILLALKDLESVEKSKKYVVHMGHWHLPDEGKCYVCFAGAVMAGTLKLSDKVNYDLHFLPGKYNGWKTALRALDFLRGSNFIDARVVWPVCRVPGVRTRRITPYSESPSAFKSAMHQLAADYAAAGA